MPAADVNQMKPHVALSTAGDLDNEATAELAARLSDKLSELDVDEIGSVPVLERRPTGSKGLELLDLAYFREGSGDTDSPP